MVVKKRKAPEGDLTPVLQEDALLACLQAERIKEINAFRLWKWVIANPKALTWDEVPWEALELPKRMKEVVPQHFVLHSSKVAERFDSADGTTTKLLVELHDGEQVEAVVMRHENRATVCVSSQVGCQMGCTFCATGTMGLRGNLSSAEVLEQLLHAGGVEKIRNVVFMGMGEPLHNYSAVLGALKAMTDVKRWSLRHGHITVSTVGVISNMKKLTQDMPNVSLALSLHGPTQAVREIIVPSAKAHPLPELLEALDRHLGNCKKKTSGAVAGMIEYILIADVNDSLECAEQLGELLSTRSVMLNLIPYNDTTEVIVNKAFKAPSFDAVDAFQAVVVKHGVITRVRREMGADISGACGQLALNNKPSSEGESGSGSNGGGAKEEGAGGGAGAAAAAVGDIEDFGQRRRRPNKTPAASASATSATSAMTSGGASSKKGKTVKSGRKSVASSSSSSSSSSVKGGVATAATTGGGSGAVAVKEAVAAEAEAGSKTDSSNSKENNSSPTVQNDESSKEPQEESDASASSSSPSSSSRPPSSWSRPSMSWFSLPTWFSRPSSSSCSSSSPHSPHFLLPSCSSWLGLLIPTTTTTAGAMALAAAAVAALAATTLAIKNSGLLKVNWSGLATKDGMRRASRTRLN